VTDRSETAIEPGGRRPGRGGRRAAILLLAVLAGLVAAGLWLSTRLEASLPRLDGVEEVAGIGAEVAIERDALGIPTIAGADRTDVAHGLGFVHAQDRFFQMDLLRRQAAGELSELFGDPALPADRGHRVHRFRSRAGAVLEAMDAADRLVVDAYVDGVNAGLAALDGIGSTCCCRPSRRRGAPRTRCSSCMRCTSSSTTRARSGNPPAA
jgi:penicillin amidase